MTTKRTLVQELKPSDFSEKKTHKLDKVTTPTAVLFYAPWCGYCVEAKPLWRRLAKETKGKVKIASFNCERYGEHLVKIRTDSPTLVTSFPTIVLYTPDGRYKKFRKERTLDNLLAFVKK